ncbi:hypothetical protein ACET3X_003677 [Alternaria dauci]|uniref:Uncharacterized protein n=1 Tax=Alternaria dauci TaxID=48095 RepID=A0ABR3UUA4_9PLEO
MILINHDTGIALCGMIPTPGIDLRLLYTVGTAAASELVLLILGAFNNLAILEPLHRAPYLLREYSLYLGELQGITPLSTNFLAAE